MRRIAISCTFLLLIAMSIIWFMKNKEPLAVPPDVVVNTPSTREWKEVDSHLDAWRNLPKAREPENNRDRTVQDRLDTFIRKTSHITAESIARERQQISQGLKNVLNLKPKIPRIKREVDEQGQVWEEIRFSDSIVRYLPVPEEDIKL